MTAGRFEKKLFRQGTRVKLTYKDVDLPKRTLITLRSWVRVNDVVKKGTLKFDNQLEDAPKHLLLDGPGVHFVTLFATVGGFTAHFRTREFEV